MTTIRYIELKSGSSDNGPAWIARAAQSKSGRTVYFNGMALKRGSGGSGNYFDAESGDEYWVSGVKKRGTNRHWAGSGRILVEADVVAELVETLDAKVLDPTLFAVTHEIRPTSASEFVAKENARLRSE